MAVRIDRDIGIIARVVGDTVILRIRVGNAQTGEKLALALVCQEAPRETGLSPGVTGVS